MLSIISKIALENACQTQDSSTGPLALQFDALPFGHRGNLKQLSSRIYLKIIVTFFLNNSSNIHNSC